MAMPMQISRNLLLVTKLFTWICSLKARNGSSNNTSWSKLSAETANSCTQREVMKFTSVETSGKPTHLRTGKVIPIQSFRVAEVKVSDVFSV